MKKAEMGVGTLIIFISMLLVAAVAAGVLIQTAGSLQEKSLATGQQARAQISTHAETIEVSATDGRNSEVTDFNQLIKLAPGSDAIKLDQVIVTFNTQDATGTLKYRGTGSVCEKNNADGYNTWAAEDVGRLTTAVNMYTLADDLDDDGADDYLYITETENLTLVFNLSSAGAISINVGANISGAGTTPVDLAFSRAAVGNSSQTFAYVEISGSTSTDNEIDADVSLLVTPYRLGEGYFAVIYEQESTNMIEGTLQRGDIVKLCFEAPRAVGESEDVRLNFIPKIGTSTLTLFTTPDVISTERVYLYP